MSNYRHLYITKPRLKAGVLRYPFRIADLMSCLIKLRQLFYKCQILDTITSQKKTVKNGGFTGFKFLQLTYR
jgi:hypothetical protein